MSVGKISFHCTRTLLIALVASWLAVLGGCAGLGDEFNNRGGYLDKKLDSYFMVADTKPMRVLRAYILIGSIAKLSREHFYRSEREGIVQNVNSAILVANDAFACAYANPADCLYFDEKMVEFESALLRLAISVFTKQENESLFSSLTKSFGDQSLLLKGVDSLTKVTEATTAFADLGVSAGKVVASLLSFGGSAYSTGRRIGALYRDAIELDMVTVLGSLQYQCHVQNGGLAEELQIAKAENFEKLKDVQQTANRFYGVNYAAKPEGLDPCATYNEGHKIWARGSGDLSDWKQFLETRAILFRKTIVPDVSAFVQASELIWRACEQITDNGGLVSRCLGARPNAYECGCYKSNDVDAKDGDCSVLADRRNANSIVTKEFDKYVQRVSGDTCPLIAFNETWKARRDRFNAAKTRLDWLSIPRGSKYRLSEVVLRPVSQSVPFESVNNGQPKGGNDCDGGRCASDAPRRQQPSQPEPPPPAKPVQLPPVQPPAPVGQKFDESTLTVAQIEKMQRALCVEPVTGALGESTSKTRQAIGEYQAATKQARTQKIDTTSQRDELLAEPCLLPSDPRSAFQHFYLAKAEQRQKFYADLQAVMTHLSTKRGKVNKVSVPAELTARSLEGAADAAAQTRLAIELIEDSLARPKRGFLNQQVLDAMRDYLPKGKVGGNPGNPPAPVTNDPPVGSPLPSPVAMTTWESQLKSDDVELLQLRLCVRSGRGFNSDTRQAIRNYQLATGKTATGSIDSEAQLGEIQNSGGCVLRPDPRSAFQKFYLAQPERAGAFYADLKVAMAYLSTKPGKSGKRVSIRPGLLSGTFNGSDAARDLVREAIGAIEESIDPLVKTGILDSRLLLVVQSYK